MALAVPTAAVIGHPIGHSLSPKIHRYWLKESSLPGDYLAHDVSSGDLAYAVKNFGAHGYRGLNMTLPHKEAVMELCDELSDAARAIGAVNTVIFQDGKILGDNTDAAGFTEQLTRSVPGKKFKAAVILGAGGAARAVVFALKQQGVGERPGSMLA